MSGQVYDYYFRHRYNEPVYVEVSKCIAGSGGTDMVDRYNIQTHNRHCDCPAYRPNCKHLDMLDEWQRLNKEEPQVMRQWYFSGLSNEFELTEPLDDGFEDFVETVTGGD